MKRSTLTGTVAACFCLGLVVPLLAAEAPVPGEKNVFAPKPAEQCLSDLRAFDGQMEKDGYWLGGSGYGYGYPMDGLGYGYGTPMERRLLTTATDYQSARPGYEIRVLAAAASILARQGQQQPCEDMLGTSRDIYKLYVAEMHSRGVRPADVPGWRQHQIATAEPVTGKNTSFRSDELLGTDVRDPQDRALGSVHDLVMSPKTGKIAYLVIARGGIFEIDEKYVPVPWDDFKITSNVNLLVLDTTKGAMDAAPQVKDDQFTVPGQFDQESKTIDTYWKAHLAGTGNDWNEGSGSSGDHDSHRGDDPRKGKD